MRDETLVLKYFEILKLVSFDAESKQDYIVYTQATADSINNGVFSPSSSTSINTPQHLYVDDTLIADVRRHILTAMSASIEALFLLFGSPD